MNATLSKSRAVAWTVWMIGAIFYAYQYVLRVMPNIMLNDIMEQFHIDAGTFGQFSGVYYIGYSLVHLPVGIFLDRYGPRKVMSVCTLLTVVGLLPFLFAEHWVYPVLGRLLIGIGSSAAILGLFKIIRMSFHEKQFPRMLSFAVMIGLIGAIYGGGPVSYMRDLYGHQSVIQLLAVAGVILAAVTYWVVPNMERGASETGVLSQVKEVLSNGRVIGLCICAGLMVGPLEGFADVWGTAFLKQVCGLDGAVAASFPSLIFIGMCFGAPALGLLAEKVSNHLLVIIATAMVMAVSFFAMLGMPMGSSLIGLLFVLVGVCSAYQVLVVYKATTYVREQVVGLTTAMANMIIMVFGYAFHTAIGSIVNAMGGPASAGALSYGVLVVPVGLCLGAAGVFVLLLKERQLQRA